MTAPIMPAPAATTAPAAGGRHARARRVRHDEFSGGQRPSVPTRVVTWIVLLIALFYFLAPVYWVIISATKSNNDLYTTSGLLPAGNNIVANYTALMEWTQHQFWRWVGNSVFYSLAAGVVGTLVSIAAGYGLSKFRTPGGVVVQGMVLAGLLFPVALMTVPLYLMFHSMGLVNTPWAVIIPSCVSPFGVFLGRIYVEASVPDELLEAARLDGASELRVFFQIVLRLLAPAMVTIFLFIFVATWNNFLLPLIVLFITLQRYWQAGLTSGAVK